MTHDVALQPSTCLSHALGDELKRIRTERNWTRRQLQARLSSDISLQTLATYELGTRQCSVARLVELCQALGVLAHEVLARAYERTVRVDDGGRLVIDLELLVRDRRSELLPLRRWASAQLGHIRPDQRRAVPLELPALENLAELCGVSTSDLITKLHELDSAGSHEPTPCRQRV